MNDPVQVTFYDPQSIPGWTDTPGLLTPLTCVAIGYLVHEDEECLVLAQVVTDDMTACNYVIPASSVVKKEYLVLAMEE